MNFIKQFSRNPKINCLSIVFVLQLITFRSLAQETAAPNNYTFTLQQAIDYALQNNSALKNAIIDEAIAKAKVDEIFGLGLPQISASFDIKNFLDIPTSLIPGEIFGGAPGSFSEVQFGTKFNATAGAQASQLIFDGNYFIGLKAAKVYNELARKQFNQTAEQTILTVSKAYYNVLINNERFQLLEVNIERVKKVLDETTALNVNGFVEKIDVDRLTVTYNNLLVEKEKTGRLLELGNYLLKFQMGMPINTKLDLTDKIVEFKMNDVELPSNNTFDYGKRNDYSLLQTAIVLQELDLKRNKLAYLPSAFAYSNLSTNAQRPTFNVFEINNASPQTKWFPTFLIGATLNIPIFDGLQKNYKIQQAKLALEKTNNSLQSAQIGIDLELASTDVNLKNSAASAETQRKNIELSEEIARVTKIKYTEGIGSNIEVLEAETSLKESQTNYYNALFDAIVAKLEYQKARGLLTK
jgi:outer membrane protein